MPRLISFTLEEIFNESVNAGVLRVGEVAPGQLALRLDRPIISRAIGLYCADLQTLLLDCKAFYFAGEDLEIVPDGVPKPHVKAVRDITVTDAVKRLPGMSQEWHEMCQEMIVAGVDAAKYTAEFKAAIGALAPKAGEGIDAVTVSSHGTGNDKKIVMKKKGGIDGTR